MASWKDPDTDLVHLIGSMGHREPKPVGRSERTLHTLGIDTAAQSMTRKVAMRCRLQVEVDDDQYLVPAEGAGLWVYRPWITTSDSPTCIACVLAVPEDKIRDHWGNKLRGA